MPMSLEQIARHIEACERCPLAASRLHAVPGEGDPAAKLLFVGEGPGQSEDEQGRPFVGAAGQLLDRMIAAIGMRREEVFIANIVKCRPPNNRVPLPEEAFACLPYLRAQVAAIRPKVIVCLGATAARAIISPETRVTRDRGAWTERKGYWMISTYHPAALLRDPIKKKDAWIDFQRIRDKLKELITPNA